ncbi:YebC/PmpR family DNA-binding transcriptional regulator [Mycoplasma sp. ATU-Cv-508]|uniref:YebC/PmpR family DNA-binding transcriptional regulator n=1 Tax=Mycoplasma sp. ATU-Cv-508 TaxID=2048001 RepID=UPI001F020F98
MAGHSKWANIKHRKGAQDVKRAQTFAKISKEIMVAVNLGGPDPQANPTLRNAISKARAASMPKKNIENAIQKASGSGAGKNYKEFVYGANVNGVAFLIICLADNANRVSSSIQSYFNKANGSVVSSSAVSYIFERKGLLEFARSANQSDDQWMLNSLESGAQDFEVGPESYFVETSPQDFQAVKTALEKRGINEWMSAEVTFCRI